jgi:hypothetical protein
MTDTPIEFDEIGDWSEVKLEIVEKYGAGPTDAYSITSSAVACGQCLRSDEAPQHAQATSNTNLARRTSTTPKLCCQYATASQVGDFPAEFGGSG